MKYRSTRGTNEETFKKVLFAGLAEDGGLYVPMNWPQIDVHKVDKNISYKDLTKLILYPYVKDFISIMELENIINLLEAGEVPLDETITLYDRGSDLKKYCELKLRSAEEKIQKISRKQLDAKDLKVEDIQK